MSTLSREVDLLREEPLCLAQVPGHSVPNFPKCEEVPPVSYSVSLRVLARFACCSVRVSALSSPVALKPPVRHCILHTGESTGLQFMTG